MKKDKRTESIFRVDKNEVKSRQPDTFGQVTGQKYQVILQFPNYVMTGAWLFGDDDRIDAHLCELQKELDDARLEIKR